MKRQDFEDTLQSCQGALHHLPLVADSDQRLEELVEEKDECGQRTDRNLDCLQNRRGAQDQESSHQPCLEYLEQRVVRRTVCNRAVLRAQCVSKNSPDPLHDAELPSKGSDHLRPNEGFLQTGVESAYCFPQQPLGPAHENLEPARNDHQDWQNKNQYHGEGQAEGAHRHEGDHQSQRFPQQADHTRREEPVDGLHVRRASADSVADWRAIIIRHGKLLQVIEELYPKAPKRPLCCD